MKKAFDQNVSRARPRLRLGALTEAADTAASHLSPPPGEVTQTVPTEDGPDVSEAQGSARLDEAVKSRAERARAPRPSANESFERALDGTARTAPTSSPERDRERTRDPEAERATQRRAEEIVAAATAAVLGEPVHASAPRSPSAQLPLDTDAPTARQAGRFAHEPQAAAAPATVEAAAPTAYAPAREPAREAARVAAPVTAPPAAAPAARAPSTPRAHIAPPAEVTEVQTQPPPVETTGLEADAEGNSEARRERLKERLRAVRENPRPEPLPPTVAEAGVLAVERIATLQSEVHKLRTVNLALTQDLEGARRQAEKATEEARLRMEESRRLSEDMEGRLRLLAELERELSALEGERDDALLSLQEARQAMEGSAKEKLELQAEIERRDVSLAESLAEEERLCSELEDAREDSTALRRSVDALKTERDTLARQVSELTRERAELLEARKALEAVHRALSQAASR